MIVLKGQARDRHAAWHGGRGAGGPRGAGDDTIVDVAAAATHNGAVTVVSADRGLATRVREHGATVVGPTWLLERLAS